MFSVEGLDRATFLFSTKYIKPSSKHFGAVMFVEHSVDGKTAAPNIVLFDSKLYKDVISIVVKLKRVTLSYNGLLIDFDSEYNHEEKLCIQFEGRTLLFEGNMFSPFVPNFRNVTSREPVYASAVCSISETLDEIVDKAKVESEP